MRAIKKIPYKFVHVYWIDIQSDSSWRSIEDVKSDDLPRCLSTGFLVSDNDDSILCPYIIEISSLSPCSVITTLYL